MSTKIVIVEDDEFLAGLAVTKLQKEGYTVLSAPDGESGLALISKEKPDLVILDLMLPGMDGFEVLGRMKEDDALKDIVVTVFSNLGGEEDYNKAMDLGANEFLIKASFTLDELVEKIKSSLAK